MISSLAPFGKPFIYLGSSSSVSVPILVLVDANPGALGEELDLLTLLVCG